MNNTKIEYVDKSWNYITGCKRECFYCYAKRIRQRFYPNVPWDELMWFDERLEQPLKVKKPSRIFVGSMSDIEYWRTIDMKRVLDIVAKCPQHTFLFLTKNGEVYSKYDFPKNCWLGVTFIGLGSYKFKVQRNRLLFLSLEPLLATPGKGFLNSLIDWVIIGAMTGQGSNEHYPREGWIRRVINEVDRLHIPIFMKNNLKKYWEGEFRQEYPNLERIRKLPQERR